MLYRAKTPVSLVFLGAIVLTAATHASLLGLSRDSAIASNYLQLVCPLLTLSLCLWEARRVRDSYLRGAWLRLGIAFAIWSVAQLTFLVLLLRLGHAPAYPSTADGFWLLFALPMLLVTVTRRTRAKWEWINWLDYAQASNFFLVLYILVFSHPAAISVSIAYEVQSVALLLACALRYSSTPPGPERIFFRNVTGFLMIYGALTTVGSRLQEAGNLPGHWVDLCWSLPFLLFCLGTLLTPASVSPRVRSQRDVKVWFPRHLHGLSALGLGIMSVSAAVVLELHRPNLGLLALSSALLLFTARTIAQESQLHAVHDTLQHSVLHDALTGLANRTYLRRELELRLVDPAADASALGLLFIDLDRFKTINDSLGHAFGDLLLVEVARLLRSCLQQEDLVVRLGGDEFVVLAKCAGESGAREVADALVTRLRLPISLEGRILYVTASVGIVMVDPSMQIDDLLRDADCAMYEAKKNGRNQSQAFERSMAEKAIDQLWIETDLRYAIDNGGLTVHYQPIYSVVQESIAGFEALARWQHPTRGMISPVDFIPTAEETGLIIKLGKQVLRKACQQVHDWNCTYHRNFTISINVSARQFEDPNLLQDILSTLADTGLPPSLLKLEITESVLLSGLSSVAEVLHSARALGVEISLDDFGTGYSSLSYLLRFPSDVVKIDRSFVQSMDRDTNRAALVLTIVQLALSLGKKVIAEGVETEEEREQLQAMHCDLLQGYLFSRPLAPEHVGALLLLQTGKQALVQPGEKRTIWAESSLGLAESLTGQDTQMRKGPAPLAGYGAQKLL